MNGIIYIFDITNININNTLKISVDKINRDFFMLPLKL